MQSTDRSQEITKGGAVRDTHESHREGARAALVIGPEIRSFTLGNGAGCRKRMTMRQIAWGVAACMSADPRRW